MAALRLTFSYEGRRIELVSAEPVDAVAPAPPLSPRGIGGFRLEVRTSAQEPLFSRPLHEPFGDSVEVIPARPGEQPQRTTVDNRRGIFVVMVPALEEAAEVALFEGPAEGMPELFADGEAREAQQPVARFALPAGSAG
jgi:hypothetical protein